MYVIYTVNGGTKVVSKIIRRDFFRNVSKLCDRKYFQREVEEDVVLDILY